MASTWAWAAGPVEAADRAGAGGFGCGGPVVGGGGGGGTVVVVVVSTGGGAVVVVVSTGAVVVVVGGSVVSSRGGTGRSTTGAPSPMAAEASARPSVRWTPTRPQTPTTT